MRHREQNETAALDKKIQGSYQRNLLTGGIPGRQPTLLTATYLVRAHSHNAAFRSLRGGHRAVVKAASTAAWAAAARPGGIGWNAAICLASAGVRAPMIGWAPWDSTQPAASALIDRSAPDAITDKSRRSPVRSTTAGSAHRRRRRKSPTVSPASPKPSARKPEASGDQARN